MHVLYTTEHARGTMAGNELTSLNKNLSLIGGGVHLGW